MLWVPVLFGAGILAYLSVPTEPGRGPVLAAAAIGVLVWILWRRGLAALVIGGSLASLVLGFAAGKLASDRVAAPVVPAGLPPVRVVGWVELVEPRARGGERVLLRVHVIDGVAPEVTPRRVRFSVPVGAGEPLVPGAAVTSVVRLLPPAGPALPGAFDFARTAWFSGLGGVGSSTGRPMATPIAAPLPLDLRLWLPVERVRHAISRRITAALDGERGAIASALITGERGGITEATNAAYRDSGIFHILSISGLHMTVFAGAVYFSIRFLLSLVPALALRFDIKKWAAMAGLAGTAGYLLISGGSPPAVRSAAMLAVMFAAVLLDRPALALRNVAVAALVILALSPPSLIDVGFQMSFAAVVALISGLDAWRAWRLRAGTVETRSAGYGSGVVLAFVGSIALTTLIATLAVAPFAAYYFHKSTQYGIIANLIAVPICNLLVMPAALATLVMMPFGLEAWPLAVMGTGIDAMTWVAERVAAIPGAIVLVAAIPVEAFSAMVVGGLWLCLWQSRLRLFGLVPILVGIGLAPFRQPPDVLIGGRGELVAVRDRDGRLAALELGRSRFELARWLEHDGDPRRIEDVVGQRAFICDHDGCSARSGAVRIAVAKHAAALEADCARSGLIIWTGAGAPVCPTGGIGPRIVTRRDLEQSGTHIGWTSGPGLRLVSVGALRGVRPWTVPASPIRVPPEARASSVPDAPWRPPPEPALTP